MGKLLEQFKKEFVTKRSSKEELAALEGNKQDPLAPYRNALEKKQSFEVSFALSTSEGTLSAVDKNGVKIILESDVLAKSLPYYKDSNKAKFIGGAFIVKATEIDEENCTVYVRSAWNSSHSTRNQLIGEIMADLDKGKEVVLPGVIIDVSDKKCMVDLLGAEILGIVNVKDWQKGYTRHLSAVVKKNEVYDFVVMRPLKERKGKTQAFKLTREPLTEDPWEELVKNTDIGKDSVVIVKCIDKPINKRFWWGVSPMIEGIELMGEFSTSIGRPMNGVTYRCKVTRFEPEKHVLQVVPFDIVDSGGIKDAVNFILDKKVFK